MTEPAGVHAFTDDVLGEQDATGVSALVASGEITALEACEAAVRRAEAVQPYVNAVHLPDYERATAPLRGVFAGVLSPTLDFDELFTRLVHYVAFTPVNNAAGGPGISLPLGRTATGLPIGCQLSADLGQDVVASLLQRYV